MTHRARVGLALALLLVPVLASGATRISVGTGSAGGVYFFVGTALTTVLNRHIPGMNATPEPVTGSAHALKLLHAGDLTIGLVELASAHFGVRGQREFDRKYDAVGFVMAGMDTGQSLVAWADSGIKGFGDVRGRRLASNSLASRAQLLAALKGYGIGEQDFQHKFLGYSEQIAALKDGSIDAGFFAVGPRNANVMDLAATRPIRILSFDAARARAFGEAFPYWTPTTIPKGTYPRQDEDLLVPALYTTLLAHRGADADLIYRIVSTLIAHGAEFGELHPGGREFTVDKTRRFVEHHLLPVGFHPGAERFWREQGVLR